MKGKTQTPEVEIEIPEIKLRHAEIKIVGDSPLICHAWSHKAKQEMLDKQMKKAKQAKAAKDPERDYQESLYHLPAGGYGFPAVAFKSAAVSAANDVGIEKVLTDDEMRAQMLENARRELSTFKTKYAILSELSSVFTAIDKLDSVPA